MSVIITNGIQVIEELDPFGKSPHEKGAKVDANKVLAGILGEFNLALLAVAEVGTFGANKYTRRGWLDVPNGQERYTDALWRHLLKSNSETLDKDSGLLHEAHLAWNTLATLQLRLEEEVDD